jgi:Brp/Blh family beta-carotene 15,15'-monooxygenase
LSVILLHHLNEVTPLLHVLGADSYDAIILDRIGVYQYQIISFLGLIFTVTAVIYFMYENNGDAHFSLNFLMYLLVMLVVTFYLPLLLGFTFYFVIWHSVLSLNNIISYLQKNHAITNRMVKKQILLYSFLALGGIGLYGLTGLMFSSISSAVGYLFLGLAVLTAPHMQIMHEMYKSIRHFKSVENYKLN